MLVKATGDACGALAYVSVGLAILIITLSFGIQFHQTEMWAVISIVIGIAFGSLFTRLTLFLSNYLQHELNNVFRSILILMLIFAILGVAGGLVASHSYNTSDLGKKCSAIEFDTNMSSGKSTVDTNDDARSNWILLPTIYQYLNISHDKDLIQQCHDYRENVLFAINVALALYLVFLIIYFVGFITVKAWRYSRNN